MPITSELKPFSIRVWGGENQKVRDTYQDITYGVLAQNVRFNDEVASFSKRDDISYFNTSSLGTGGIRSGVRFYTTGGVSKHVVSWTTGVYVGTDSNGTLTAIKTGLTDGKKFSWVLYNNLLIFGNGYDDIQVYDGSADNVTWELGSCKAKIGSSTGITRTAISYQVTMDTDAYICGAVSNTIASVTNQSIDLTNIPLGPIGTTNRRIYRKSSETSGYRLITTIANNTATTYTDSTADASGGTALPTVTDDMPKGKILKTHRERLFITGDPNNPNRVYYSRAFLPGYIQQTTALDYLDVNPNDGDEIMNIPIWYGVMRCVKRNTIRNVVVSSATSGADPDSWYTEDPITYVGAISPWCVEETPEGIYFCGYDHWYVFDGTKATPMIDEFDVNKIAKSRITDITTMYFQNELLAAYSDAAAGNAYNDRLMRYNMLRKRLSFDKINVSSMWGKTGNDEAGDLFYGDSVSGYAKRADRALQTYSLRTKTDVNLGTKTDIYVSGDENDPTIQIGRTATINALAGTINAQSGTIDMPDTGGTYTSPTIQLNVGTFGRLYWNEALNTGDNILFYTKTASTEAGLAIASWDGPFTDPNGSSVTSTANTWFQYKAELTANSTAASPSIYFSDGFLVKLTYYIGSTSSESAVEMDYQTGFRNFGTEEEPLLAIQDKIFKKLTSIHNGSQGTVTIYWETELGFSGSFVFDLAVYPKRFETFFPDTAFGRQIKFRIYKNDLYSYTQKELHGLFTPEPVTV